MGYTGHMTYFILRRVLVSLVITAGIMCAMLWAGANQTHHNVDRPAAVGSPAWYMEGCASTPVGEFPSRVIMFPKGEGFVVSTTKPRLIHEALEQALNGKDFGHEIVGFCK